MPPLRLPFRHAGYLVALVLADIQIAWITFNRGRYQQTSRIDSGHCCQFVATRL